MLEIDESAALSRDELQAVLWAENVLARRYFFPGCHRMEPYRSLFPDAARRLPQTERLVQRVLALPTGTSMSTEAVETVADVVTRAMRSTERACARPSKTSA